MRRRLECLVAAAAVVAASTAPVLAADLIRKAPSPAAVAAAYDWSGFYIGAHVGGGWAHKGWSDRDPSCITTNVTFCTPTDLGSHTARGILGGGQVGFNWQSGRAVFGIEAQYSFANLRGDHASTFVLTDGAIFELTANNALATKVRALATIAGRLGLALEPYRSLLYVKGGAAYADEKYSMTINETLLAVVPGMIQTTGTVAGSQQRWGWMVGAGVEQAISGPWSVKLEYNFLDFGEKDVRLTGTACSVGAGLPGCFSESRELRVDQHVHLVKFGLNYRFGGGPIAARY